jgi:hypothetical protein
MELISNIIENNRANRISIRICCSHDSLSSIYESLCDREYVSAKEEVKKIISDMKQILKSIEEDDF